MHCLTHELKVFAILDAHVELGGYLKVRHYAFFLTLEIQPHAKGDRPCWLSVIRHRVLVEIILLF